MHVRGSGLESDLTTSTFSHQQVTGGGGLGGRRNFPPAQHQGWRAKTSETGHRPPLQPHGWTPVGTGGARLHCGLQDRARMSRMSRPLRAHSSPHSVLPVLPVLPVLASAAEELTRPPSCQTCVGNLERRPAAWRLWNACCFPGRDFLAPLIPPSR